MSLSIPAALGASVCLISAIVGPYFAGVYLGFQLLPVIVLFFVGWAIGRRRQPILINYHQSVAWLTIVCVAVLWMFLPDQGPPT